MIIQLESGQKLEVQDGATPQQIDEVAQHISGQSPVINEPTDKQKAIGSTTGGIVTGVLDPVYGISQLAPRAVSAISSLGGNFPNPVSRAADASAAKQDIGAHELIHNREDARAATGQTGFDWPQLAGNMISPANAVVGAGAGAFSPAAGLLGKLAQGAGVGAAYGLTSPVDVEKGSFTGQKIGQAGSGAIVGAAAPVIGQVIGNTIYPAVGEAQKILSDAGVRMTPGQMTGGAARRIENGATSIPLVGDAIIGAQKRGYDDFNRSVANRALTPIGQSLPDHVATGHDSVAFVQNALSDNYNKILPKMTGVIDNDLTNDFSKIWTEAQLLPDEKANQLQKILSNTLDKKVQPNGTISGRDLEEVMSTLGQESANYRSDSSADGRKMGWLLGETKDAFSQMLQRNNSPELSAELAKTDEGFANFIRLQRAAGSVNAAGKDGVFTPAQLLSAVKSSDKSLRKGAFSKGEALMQDLAGAGQKVLPSNVPDSGTGFRAGIGLLGLGGGAMVHPGAAALGALAAGAYTEPGQALIRGMSARPDALNPLANLIKEYSNPVAIARKASGR